MKWLSLKFIKQHSRIDFNCEDKLLALYGNSAEETVLKVCNMTYDELIKEYGEVPAALYHAALMLVDAAYKERAPMSAQQMYVVPYTFDILVKPFIRLV